MVTSDFRSEVKIRPFCACAMHPAIIIGTVPLSWTRLWGRYHVPHNVFPVVYNGHSIVYLLRLNVLQCLNILIAVKISHTAPPTIFNTLYLVK